MRKLMPFALILALCVSAVAVAQKRETPASASELAQITERGRQLAEYDVAAWHATDAVQALSPPEGSVAPYIAMKTEAGWAVVFGRFNEKRDKFLIAYEATQGATPTDFKVKKHDLPKEDAGFYFTAAKAIDTALADFRGEQRPYNVAALPSKSGQVYVYVLPAQTKQNVYPHGGDVRYLISQDGAKIVEKRQMHRSIIELEFGSNTEGGFHTAIVDNVPEDTDVFYVLSRKPSAPEFIMTEKFLYRVETDGTVRYMMTKEAFLKIDKKPR